MGLLSEGHVDGGCQDACGHLKRVRDPQSSSGLLQSEINKVSQNCDLDV